MISAKPPERHFPKSSPRIGGRFREAERRFGGGLLLAALLLAFDRGCLAQTPPLSARDTAYYRYLSFASLIKGGTVQAHWMTDGNRFWYASGAPDKTIIYTVDPAANTQTPLFDTAQVRRRLTPLLGHEPPYQGLPFSDFTFIDEEKAVTFTVEEREFRLSLANGAITPRMRTSEEEKARTTPQLVKKAFHALDTDVLEIPSPDMRWFLGVKDHNLSLRASYDGRSQPLTTDGVKDDEWEAGGAVWSPDSLHVAATKVDSHNLPLLPIVHWLKPTEEVEWFRYSKAGGPIPQPRLYVIDILSKHAVQIDSGRDPDAVLFPLGWIGSELAFMRLSRNWKSYTLMAADPKTGDSRVVLDETEKTFVQPGTPTFLQSGDRFIWPSERDGWNHLYLYDMRGHPIRRLTEGSFPVVSVVALDEKAGWVYFTAHGEKRLYDTHLYRVDLEGRHFTRPTEGPGKHEIQFSPSNCFFVDTHSSTAQPPITELRRADGTPVRTLSTADVSRLKDLHWSAPEEFIVKADDGKTDLYGLLYKPNDFDPQKRYPVIDYIYGGPQTTWTPRTFNDPLAIHPQALAQLGFIVFIVDARGTPERGKAFQDVVYGKFGQHEIQDHVTVLKQLAQKRSFMDLTRVGIMGGSWGGYMTVRAMLTAPDVYQAGISTFPVVDLYDHWAQPIEPYMDLPQNNREGYEAASCLPLADKLKGHLLLIHGTSDVNATFSSTMKMAEAFIRANKPFDLLILPEQTHAPTGQSLLYWLDAEKRYLVEHLKP